jgi:phenylacetaldehyde dehydrogenase
MLDNGKLLKVARVADVPLAVDLFRYMAAGQPRLKATPSRFPPAPFLAYTLRQPVGGGRSSRGISLAHGGLKLGPALATDAA